MVGRRWWFVCGADGRHREIVFAERRSTFRQNALAAADDRRSECIGDRLAFGRGLLRRKQRLCRPDPGRATCVIVRNAVKYNGTAD